MARILFNCAAAVSLVLCVGAIIMWAWSYSAHLECGRRTAWAYHAIGTSRGGLIGVAVRNPNPEALSSGVAAPWYGMTAPTRNLPEIAANFVPDTRSPVGGFVFGHAVRRGRSITVVLLPAWFAVALFAVMPSVAGTRYLRRRRRVRRIAAGCCAGCGYDLRASPGRCPECGRITGADGASTPLDIRP